MKCMYMYMDVNRDPNSGVSAPTFPKILARAPKF